MKKKVTLLSLIVYVLTSFSTSQAAEKIDFLFRKGIKLDLLVGTDIAYCKDDSTFYYCSTTLIKRNDSVLVELRKCNLYNENKGSYIVNLPKSESILNWSIIAISVRNENVAVLCDSLYIFNTTDGTVKTNNRLGCQSVSWISDRMLLLSKNYNSHPLSDSIKSKIILFDSKTNTIIKYIKPEFDYIVYTHFVNNFVDVKMNKIAFSNTIPYEITIYDTDNLVVSDKIRDSSLRNTESCINKIHAIHVESRKEHNAKKYYYKLKILDSTVNRIEKIHFLNDSVLLVSKKFPMSGYERRLIDIWEYKNSIWSKIIDNQMYTTETPNKDYLITQESLPLDLTFSSKILCDNKYIYIVNTKAPPAMNINNKELDQYYDGFYEENELNYYIWVYQWEVK